MPRIVDRSGQRYGLMTVLHRAARTGDRIVRWIAVCDCHPEAKITVEVAKLTKTSHCGCLDSRVDTDVSHNHSRHSAGQDRVLWPISSTTSESPKNTEHRVEGDVAGVLSFPAVGPSEHHLAA